MAGSARRTRAGLPLPKLYPITDRRIAGGLDHPAIVERLAAGGARLVQVREKELDDRALVEQVRRCLRIPGIILVVNDRADVALACGAAGVHLGDEDLPVEDARALLGPQALIGRSTHSPDEAESACALEVDYVAIGPVFETATKRAGRAPLGLEAVREAAARVSRPLVAIGGITLESAPMVLEAGADSVAVVSDILAAESIEARAAEWAARIGERG